MAKSTPTTQRNELEQLRLRVAELEKEQHLRANTEEQLQEANTELSKRKIQLEAMVSNAAVVLFALDRDGIFTVSEGAALSLLGLKAGQAVGQSVFEFFSDNPQIISECRRAISGESFRSIVEVGDLVFATHYNPLHDSDGALTGTIGVSINITETYLAQRARDESEAKYRSLVNTAPTTIMTVDRAGDILFVNRTVDGFTVEDLIGTNIEMYISKDQQRVQNDALKKVFETGEPTKYETWRKKANGKIAWYSSRVGPVEHDGKIIAATIIANDVTDSHLAQQALFESEAKYRSVVDNAPAFIITADLDGRIQFINQTVPDLTVEEVLGTSIYDHLDDEQKAISQQAIGKAIETGKPTTYEIWRLDPNGNKAWFSCCAGPIEREGRAVAITIIATDTTRQRQAFDALHESEERFRSTFESASIPMAICDEKRGFLKANEAFASLFGYSEDQLRGIKFDDLAYPQDLSQGERLFEDLIGSQLDHFHIESRYLTRNGHVVWGNVTVSATRDANDDLRHIVIMLEDITDRKRVEEELLAAHNDLNLRVERRTVELTSANEQLREEILERNRVESALRESEAKVRALLDAIPDLMLRIHRDGTFLDYHAKDDSDLAMPTTGLTGKIINKVMPIHVAKSVMDRVHDALSTKKLQVFEYDLPSRDDAANASMIQTHEARIVVSGLDEVLVIIRNITERRRAEEQAAEHQAQLAHVSRLNSMGEMATDLAHELNQPLAAIMNYAEHCVREMSTSPDTPEHWIDGANQVIAQAERAGKIIKRIRSFVERREPQDDPLQINETVGNAVDMAATDARHRQVEVQLQLGSQMPLVTGDAIQIEQVVLNLVRNAIDAMVEAGVEKRIIHITTEVIEGQMIQVRVADNGPGLVKASIDKVFEPFYTTKPDGLGMGLTISRSIVEAHGGKLSVQNNALTQGASFQFTLPIHPQGESKVSDVERTDRVRSG